VEFLEGCRAGRATSVVERLVTSVAGESVRSDSGRHGESWESEKSPREHRAKRRWQHRRGATDFSVEKPLRSGQGQHFGAGGVNGERGGALATGRAAAEEGKASKGVMRPEEGRKVGGNVASRLETGRTP
jgi:hypothetical protein